jgi:SAM-dependent methyltransferase
MSPTADIKRIIGDYYSSKLQLHGATARGVDWNSEESQSLRFDQLLKVSSHAGDVSINEIGCGYGALVDHLRQRRLAIQYYGVDLSADMVASARNTHSEVDWAAFAIGDRPDRPRDYCVASGIFNVRLQIELTDWRKLVFDTLDMMHEFGTSGFAFNALTSYSDAAKKRNDLYYADPMEIFDHCKRRYSRHVALLHDYGLYEFTILVSNNPRI